LKELREGEPCSHKGYLNHVSHPCEGCGRISEKHTIESAIESYKFGFSVTYDGDNNKIKYGTICNRCGKYFESYSLGVYCLDCCIDYIANLKSVTRR
jgi:hypothetical protein